MGITFKNEPKTPSYPYVGQHRFSALKVLFIEPRTGFSLKGGARSHTWKEDHFDPIVHTITFDLS